jgi:hypothetical protein
LGAGCDGRDDVAARFCARTNGTLRTVKSCGPGTPVLALNRRDVSPMTGAIKPVPGEITYKL